ncbi:MAG: hypothetical protein COB36_00710 [Alphaproteobacteria bacterium]|nr:MAG: hypothetical protein COB36_00710 [Alphaproteobacteria bacterium]
MLNDFQHSFSEIKKYLNSIPASDDWVDSGALLDTFDYVSYKFDDHYQRALVDLEYIFSDNTDAIYQTEQTVLLLDKWAKSDDPVSIFSVVAAALKYFNFSSEQGENDTLPTLMAAMLADVPNILDYHNNRHFCKVVLHTIRMIVTHNNIWPSGQNYLDNSKTSLLIAAAAIHDLGHQGGGNIIDRKYHMAQVERRSYDLVYPYLNAAGFSEDTLNDMKVMLTTTDVSPFGDPISPVSQMRRAYEFHYGSADEMGDHAALMLSDDLSVLADRSVLCLMCLILHEADIMNSAAVDYDITCHESVSVSRELGLSHALPEGTLLFLERICAGKMLSDSARYLGAANLAKILQRVMEDYKSGNKSYM